MSGRTRSIAFLPGRRQDAKPVLPAQLCKIGFSIANVPKGGNQLLVTCGIANFLWNRRTVEVRSEADAIDTGTFHKIINMAHHGLDRRIGIRTRILAQHGRRIVEADDAVAFLDGVDLLVG